VKEDGVYLCEDLHTSYDRGFGGGYKRRRSFIEFSKNFIDKLHAWYKPKKIKIDSFVRSVHSLHYYDSILVIQKRRMVALFDVKSGEPAIRTLIQTQRGKALAPENDLLNKPINPVSFLYLRS
jgi:hypothetical protein